MATVRGLRGTNNFGPNERTISVQDLPPPEPPPTPVQIPQGDGTAIGDMTAAGGLAASFDGNDDQPGSASSAKVDATEAFVGKTLSSAQVIDHIVAYGANDQGFVVNADISVTLNLRAKTGAAPTNSADGTLLGSITFMDGQIRTIHNIESNDKTTLFAHAWLEVIPAAMNSLRVAELEIWTLE